jgi:molybdate transport system substrate-binding protein
LKQFSSRFLRLIGAALMLFPLTGCLGDANHRSDGGTRSEAVTLHVLAAASLSAPLNELIRQYESKHPDVKLVTHYASSGTLQKQIEQGAPADLFLSAASQQVDELKEKGMIGDHSVLLKNRLVLIVPKNSAAVISRFSDLESPSVKRIAVGHPDTVPAGTYAKQTLTHLGVWERIQPKLVFAKDVRQVLTYVESGNVDAGFVYKTDALASDRVRLSVTAAEESHEPIVCPIGVVKATKHPDEAKAFYDWLHSPEAQDVFERHGFQGGVP